MLKPGAKLGPERGQDTAHPRPTLPPKSCFASHLAKRLVYAQTPLKSRGLRQQELQTQAPAIPNQSPKAIRDTKQVPGVLKATPLPNSPSVCAPTYVSHLQVEDALDIKIAKESWTECVRSPGNLAFPWSTGPCFLRTVHPIFPPAIAKTSSVDSTLLGYIRKNAWRGFQQHSKEITLSQAQEGETGDPPTICVHPTMFPTIPCLAQLQQTSLSPCQACPLPADFPW